MQFPDLEVKEAQDDWDQQEELYPNVRDTKDWTKSRSKRQLVSKNNFWLKKVKIGQL